LQKLAAIPAILLFCLLEASGQLPDYHVDLINTRSGINLAGAREVIQDHKGFLWILSENNLQRYDGSSVKTFNPAPLLKNVLCDNSGNIWLVSQRAVYRYVNDHSGFEQVTTDSVATYLFGIYQLPDRSYWVSHTKGLMKYDSAGRQFVSVQLPFLNEKRSKSLVNRIIKTVEQRGNLFCL
jgi:ligand-binding sensor domain-containing protein